MVNADTAKRIEAPADRVWQILTGKEMIELITSIYGESAVFDNGAEGPAAAGAGAILTTTLKDGKGTIRERIEDIDDGERCMKYRVIDVGPFPFADYRGQMSVTPSGPDACNVVFMTSFVSVGVPEAESTQVWLGNNNNMLEGLSKFAAS